MIFVKTQLKMESQCNRNQDKLLLHQKQLKKKQRMWDQGPLVNLVRLGVDGSEIVCDLFASFTNRQVSQAFEL